MCPKLAHGDVEPELRGLDGVNTRCLPSLHGLGAGGFEVEVKVEFEVEGEVCGMPPSQFSEYRGLSTFAFSAHVSLD